MGCSKQRVGDTGWEYDAAYWCKTYILNSRSYFFTFLVHLNPTASSILWEQYETFFMWPIFRCNGSLSQDLQSRGILISKSMTIDKRVALLIQLIPMYPNHFHLPLSKMFTFYLGRNGPLWCKTAVQRKSPRSWTTAAWSFRSLMQLTRLWELVYRWQVERRRRHPSQPSAEEAKQDPGCVWFDLPLHLLPWECQ